MAVARPPSRELSNKSGCCGQILGEVKKVRAQRQYQIFFPSESITLFESIDQGCNVELTQLEAMVMLGESGV